MDNQIGNTETVNSDINSNVKRKILKSFFVISLLLVGFFLGNTYSILKNVGIEKVPVKTQTSTQPVISTITQPLVIPQDNKNTYINADYGFSFSYPKSWSLKEYEIENTNNDGVLVDVEDPNPARSTPGYSKSFSVSFYKSINDENARGGSWVGERSYLNLEDFFTDQNSPSVSKSGLITLDNRTAYEVTIGGNGQMYGVMFETSRGVFSLAFPRAWEKNDLDVEEKELLNSFKFLLTTSVNQEISFDGCGKINKYSANPWYSQLKSILNNTNLNIENINDSCLSNDNSTFIFTVPGEYCGPPKVYQYQIKSNKLESAKVLSKDRGCLTETLEFGTRDGMSIQMTGRGGDAGCESFMYFNFNYVTNELELKREHSICENDLLEGGNGLWYYY